MEQKENNKDYELFDAEKFKNGYVSSLTGFIAEKVQEYNALVSFENLNIAGGKDGNLRKTFGTTVYQIIENKLISKLGYCVVKKSPNNHFQVAPKIRRIEELKKDIVSGDEKNKDYQLGFVQITDESNTSKICPNCGYSKNRYHNSSCENNILDLVLKTDKLQNIDFGIDESKKKEFPINSETVAYKYSQDGIMTESLKQDNKDFCKTICDTRQNQTKSKDFIRCVYCGFDSRLPEKNNQKLEKIDGGDILATYNIAKR